ncbi:WXG100 family type VII secretion target [Actinophytocola sp. NPDC049390]|uniref:WXG100 family type VII secretion target n=1 Tax=Actinophytocola sp. NPDC049390 TaxID=3363894 RepID=UPI0037A475BC
MHVPDDYDRDRRNETWREVHGLSERARKRRAALRRKRRRNREPGRFGKVNWEAYQHDQLYDMIHRANVAEMANRAGQWSTLAAKIEATTGDVQRVMERVMGAWHGQAAVSSAESSTRLMRWAGSASQTAGRIAQGMSSYAEAVDRAQSRMPKPGFASAERNFRDGYTVVGTGGPSTAVLLKELLTDGMVSHEEARSRKAEAVQVMAAYEAQSKDVHDTMPHFSDAAPTTNQSVEDGPGTQWADDPVPEHTPPQSTPATPPSVSGPGNAATSASSVADPALAGGRGTSGGVPGAFGGPGGGVGSLGSGGSDVIRNSPGFGAGGLAGAGPVPGRGAAGAGGLLGGARGAGAAGAFGGMPVGHGAQGEEDKEHRNKYDQGMDFFDDLPPAYPPVFGA